LLSACRKVLIEGIETERDRTWALQAADFGQGLLAVLDMAGGLKRHFEGDHANDSAPLPAAAYRK
jgi:hypothetical protein